MNQIQIFPSGSKIKCEKEYQAWLKSLKKGDLCFVQCFHPKSKSLLEFDLEFWAFSIVRILKIEGDKIITEGRTFGSIAYQDHFNNGILTYIDSSEYFESDCFCIRLVKLLPKLLPKTFDSESYDEYDTSFLILDSPIYEPKFSGGRVFLLQEQPGEILPQKDMITSSFPSYSYHVYKADIIVCFPGEQLAFDFENWLKKNAIDNVKYLYCEPI